MNNAHQDRTTVQIRYQSVNMRRVEPPITK